MVSFVEVLGNSVWLVVANGDVVEELCSVVAVDDSVEADTSEVVCGVGVSCVVVCCLGAFEEEAFIDVVVGNVVLT